MIRQALEFTSNTMIIATASFATITHEDYRLWVIALISLILANINKIWLWRESSYKSMRERLRLCSECKKNGSTLTSCVVQEKFRPKGCLLKK